MKIKNRIMAVLVVIVLLMSLTTTFALAKENSRPCNNCWFIVLDVKYEYQHSSTHCPWHSQICSRVRAVTTERAVCGGILPPCTYAGTKRIVTSPWSQWMCSSK
jgi:hypothetical protein